MSTDSRPVYDALSRLGGRYARHPGDPASEGDLTPHELRVFSQNGEDGVVEEILRRIGVATRSCVEFGIESGIEGNCVFLADVLGWDALFMESHPERFAALAGKYRHRPGVRTVQATVGPENIDGLLDGAGVPTELDVMSIDVDGADYWIWKAIERVRPRLVVIEYNAALDPRRRLVQPLEPREGWDGTDYFGASLGALTSLAHAKGYRLVHTDLAGVNAFYVARELAAPFPPEERVPLRAPNYFLTGRGHPAHRGGRAYIDLDEGP
jgi:hypothetical protein